MKVFSITEEQKPMFMDLIPKMLYTKQYTLFGCTKDDVPCAVAAFEKEKANWNLSWLWVSPDVRNTGVGSTLLDYSCAAVFANGGQNISVNYHSEEAWTAFMDYMLQKRGFLLKICKIPKFYLTKQEILKSLLMSKENEVKWNSGIVPLSSLRTQQITSLYMDCEKFGVFQVSRANLQNADNDLSMAIVVDDQVQGMTLMRDIGDGKMVLDLFYLSKPNVVKGMALLRQTIYHALENGMKEIEFFCVDDTAHRLAEYLTNKKSEMFSVCRAVCYAGMYCRKETQYD